MKKLMLFALLAGELVVLAAAPDAEGRGRRNCGGGYAPVYYPPPPNYYMPNYYPPRQPMPPARPEVEVGAIDGKGFEPKTVNVAPGTTVRWVNHGKERHTVTSRDGLFDSELPPGGTYRVTFTRPGTFHYFCRPHEKMGMVGTVIVGQSSGPEGAGGKVGPGY
jgi:plastocyanin